MILMVENGSGKSTLLEALSVLSGFTTTGGGAWADPSLADQSSDAGALAGYLRGAWLPKDQRGWFLKAQGFADVSRMMQKDYLGFSHGEGFAEMMLDRMNGQGVYFLDKPEAALSPRRQAQIMAFWADVQAEASAQVVMATHSPILMAVPGATLLRISHRGITPVSLRDTDHFQLWASFTADPDAFVQAAMGGDLDTLA